MHIGIMDATGPVGGAVLERLREFEPIAIVRDLATVPSGFETRVAACCDAASCESAFAGLDALLLVPAIESADGTHTNRTAIEAATAAGVDHVVYTSFAGAAPDASSTLGAQHFDGEVALRESGLSSTVLRPSLYLEAMTMFADLEGVIRGPAGDGLVSAVSRADVAEAAATLLRDADDPHRGGTYTLTGPESFTLEEFARRASVALSVALRFEHEELAAAYAWRTDGYDVGVWQVEAWISTSLAIAEGDLEGVSPDLEALLGRPGRTLEQAFASPAPAL